MSYSISAILHPRKDKQGLQKIQIRIIYNRKKYYLPTDIKVEEKFFSAGSIAGHPKADRYNQNIRKIISDAEDLILDQIRAGRKELSFQIETSKDKPVFDFIIDLLDSSKESYSPGSIKHYRSVANKIELWKPGLMLSEISVPLLEQFEMYLRRSAPHGKGEKKLDINTVNNVMKRLKALLTRSGIEESKFRKYKVPAYKQKLFDYLTETEVDSLFNLVRTIGQPSYKLAGYYFLFSCKTGYRISDLKVFDFNKMVSGQTIVLRAKKNNSIVSIPVYESLSEVLQYIKDNPFTLSEQKARLYLKKICLMAGITKNVSYHTGRRTWAMTLLSKGFTISEVAETLGDSVKVASVYAKMNNSILAKRIIENLK